MPPAGERSPLVVAPPAFHCIPSGNRLRSPEQGGRRQDFSFYIFRTQRHPELLYEVQLRNGYHGLQGCVCFSSEAVVDMF